MPRKLRFTFALVLLVLLAIVGFPAFGQVVAEAPVPATTENQITGIAVAVVGVLAFAGSLVARWSETNPDLPWFVRLSRVFDATQIVDSTRRLGDE